MKKVLVIRMSALGDVAMAAPVLASLVDTYTDDKFTVLTRDRFKPIFEPIIGLKVLGLPIDTHYKKPYQFPSLVRAIDVNKYDVIIDFHDVLRSRAITSYAVLRGKKIARIDKNRKGRKQILRGDRRLDHPLQNMMEVYQAACNQGGFPLAHLEIDARIYHVEGLKLDQIGGVPFKIGLAPFARYAEKSLPLEKIKELIKLLNQNEVIPFIIGGGSQEYRWTQELVSSVKAVNLINRYTLAEEISLIRDMDLMITMDSANMHLARLVGVETISIWGATHPALGFGGWKMTSSDFFRIAEGSLSCQPCSVFGNVPCKRVDLACLHRLDLSDLVAKALSRLKNVA